MVVAIDNADPSDMNNVHPKNKQEIGRRLALAGMALAYNGKEPYSGPVYSAMKVEGNTIRLSFAQAKDGLTLIDRKKADGTYDASITANRQSSVSPGFSGFAVAGADKKFVWADARVDGNTIVVSAPSVPNPVAVRYGWGNNPPTSLYSKSGLPASPFRTDM
jgi:sialate O-acetylesterase